MERGKKRSREEFEEDEQPVAKSQASKKIKLDVGGQTFSTSLSTLNSFPDSMLGAWFSGRHPLEPGDDGAYFIDRDGTNFSVRPGCMPLSFLRCIAEMANSSYIALDGEWECIKPPL